MTLKATGCRNRYRKSGAAENRGANAEEGSTGHFLTELLLDDFQMVKEAFENADAEMQQHILDTMNIKSIDEGSIEMKL